MRENDKVWFWAIEGTEIKKLPGVVVLEEDEARLVQHSPEEDGRELCGDIHNMSGKAIDRRYKTLMDLCKTEGIELESVFARAGLKGKQDLRIIERRG